MRNRNKKSKPDHETITPEPAPIVEREPVPACACGSPKLNTLGVNSKLIDGQRINWTRRRCPKCGKATTERSCLMI